MSSCHRKVGPPFDRPLSAVSFHFVLATIVLDVHSSHLPLYRTWSLVPWYLGTLVPWYIGTLVLWYIGTMVHWDACDVVSRCVSASCRRLIRQPQEGAGSLSNPSREAAGEVAVAQHCDPSLLGQTVTANPAAAKAASAAALMRVSSRRSRSRMSSQGSWQRRSW